MNVLSFTAFNLLEGTFWIFCGILSYVAPHFIHDMSERFWKVLTLNFVLFGLSDYVEAYYPVSFLDKGGEWLYAWKILCIIGFVGCLIWYIAKRISK